MYIIISEKIKRSGATHKRRKSGFCNDGSNYLMPNYENQTDKTGQLVIETSFMHAAQATLKIAPRRH